jgi:hypothetical protein
MAWHLDGPGQIAALLRGVASFGDRKSSRRARLINMAFDESVTLL